MCVSTRERNQFPSVLLQPRADDPRCGYRRPVRCVPDEVAAIPNRLDLSRPSSLPCSTHCGSWFVQCGVAPGDRRRGTSWLSHIVPAVGGVPSPLSTVCGGPSCRSDGPAGARYSMSCSRRRCSPGIGAALACSKRERADIAPAVALTRGGFVKCLREAALERTVTGARLPTAHRVVAPTRLGGMHHHYQLEPVAA
jgi:hypothetical protein